ncbi:Sec-independent protein translocase protein TatA [Methanimicrococcus stummii]|uniref:Sec-independent protein translocase protein TatA n=1 Tax=Methanimicrococcus stummii TaxID=3028294 RepID=A0AA96V9T4_9EURY|nr:twin-arginine translocase TatA/TatE family subunit [Methanimicrococcus sp. Es2]WNY28375.1 Sec-independent protein translocase protein TatA [Methanimicrococcus sp. Es2]
MIGGLEVLFIIIVVLVLFGPDKIPELARAVGGAMGEFKTAQKAAEFDLSGFDALNRENAEAKKKETAALNEKIIKMADEAGISTEGKTADELLVLISEKMSTDSEDVSKTEGVDKAEKLEPQINSKTESVDSQQ